MAVNLVKAETHTAFQSMSIRISVSPEVSYHEKQYEKDTCILELTLTCLLVNKRLYSFVVSSSDSTTATKDYETDEVTTDSKVKIALQNAVIAAAKGAPINHLISTSAIKQPIEPNVSQIEHLRAAIFQDHANVVAMYNGGLFTPPIQITAPQAAAGLHNCSLELNVEQTSIRQKEIEKALHSKPQRGRKRANLNEIERLELTRTRNREHAKSTRFRKKMRYEELLDCESRIKVIEANQDLDHRRRCCVFTFLSYREKMLHEHTLTNVESDLPLKLMCLFQDNTNVLYDDGSCHTENFTALERMQKFDGNLLSGIFDNTRPLSYKTKDSSGLHSIAFTQSGTALVEVDVVQTVGVNIDNILKSYLLKITFGPESDKIRSISILHITRSREVNVMSIVDQPNTINKGQQNLEGQRSYPSVVSLDVEKDHRRSVNEVDEKRCECDDGIGMSF